MFGYIRVGLVNVMQQFSNLSTENKRKFVNYVTNQQIMNNVLDELSSGIMGKELCGGDIVVENEDYNKESETFAGDCEPIMKYISSLLFIEVSAAPSIREYTVSHSNKAGYFRY